MWDQWSINDFVVAASAFLLLLALWMMGLLLWRLRRSKLADQLHERLGLRGRESSPRELRLWRDGKEATTTVPGPPPRPSVMARLDQFLRDAGWNIPPQMLLVWIGGIVLISFVLTIIVTDSAIGAATVTLVLLAILWGYLDRRIRKREALAEKQLVDGLELAARSLRAGHPLLAAFHLIAEEIEPPTATIFAKICQQQTMGLSLEDSLRQVADESGKEDLKLFATAVIIQLRSGGNLADMMIRLASVIRNRMQISRHIRVLTAQTRFSKRVLLAVPFVLFISVSIINPSYMRPLFTTFVGRVLLGIASVGMLLGAWIMKRLAVLKY